MSTTFIPIKGTIEIPDVQLMKSDYSPALLHVSRFYGGEERGLSFQLGIEDVENGKYSHIQLDNESTKKLFEILSVWFESEENNENS